MLTEEQMARRDELLAKDKLNKSERDELDDLAKQEGATLIAPTADPDHSPEPALTHGLSDEDRAKLIALRARMQSTPLDDAEVAEMERLSLAESEAAGTVAPPAPPTPPNTVEYAFAEMMSHLFAAFEHIAATVPAAAGVSAFVRTGRAHLDAFRKHLDER